MSNAGYPDDLAVLLHLHTRLDGLEREIGQGNRNDDLYPAVAGHVGHLRKILAWFAAQLFGRGGPVGHAGR